MASTAPVVGAGGVVLSCTGLTDRARGTTNCAYVPQAAFTDLLANQQMPLVSVPGESHAGIPCRLADCVFVVLPGAAAAGSVELGSFQRISANLALRDAVPITPLAKMPAIASMDIQLSTPGRSSTSDVNAETVKQLMQNKFANFVFQVGQQFVIIYEKVLQLKVQITDITLLDPHADDGAEEKKDDGSGSGASKAAADGTMPGTAGQFVKGTDLGVTKHKSASFKLTGSASTRGPRLLSSSFNFEELGIGGLDREFQVIFRKAFVARTFPAHIVAEMGMKHVRGMLLFGPPGCGKTLIARQIGKALNAHPPKVVNGPEILSKWVGGSEENIRKLFAEAEEEQAERGDDSDLHIIIFDEIDAICKSRGSTRDGTGVHDSVVNQLLSKIDGVDALNNILLIGMTNRKDMIDSALLRPGRLEVHVEINLPDEAGRQQILRIHTKLLRESKRLSDDVDLGYLAKRTNNFTGAELEALVRAAGQIGMMRQADTANLGHITEAAKVKVYRQDFMQALDETSPQFGVAEDEITALYPGGMIHYGATFSQLWAKLRANVMQVENSSKTHMLSMLLHGSAGVGKTAIAGKLATECNFPFVKRIGGDTLVGMSESSRVSKIIAAFEDAYKSPTSMIILDDLERILGYVRMGPRFANPVLQTLMVMCKRPPPKAGCKLVVVATTSAFSDLNMLGLTDNTVFNVITEVPPLMSASDITKVIVETTEESTVFTPKDVAAIADHLSATAELDPIPISLLLRVLDAAEQETSSQDGLERFKACMTQYGLQ